jgi:phosphate transport system permease protein
MTSAISQNPMTPKPGKPWEPTLKERSQKILNFFIALGLSFVLLFTTGLNGKLGWFIGFFLSFTVVSFIAEFRRAGKPAAQDSLLTSVSRFAITLAVIPIVSILATVAVKGWRGLHWGLFTQDMAQATVNDPIQNGGMLAAIIGTLIMVSLALIFTLPISILTALYLTEIKGKFTRPIRFLVQAMSGVPSIVAGLFILSSVIYPITGERTGLMGALALAILMIPTVARTAEEVLLLIPNDLREAGLALGATQWRTVAMVVVPAVKSGLVTAIILGVARVIGETAPILLVSGGGESTNFNPVSGPMGSIPYYVWKSFQLGGTEESSQRTWAGLLVLILWVLFLFTIARYISSRSQKR